MATASLADTSLVNQPSTANQSSAPNLIRFCEGCNNMLYGQEATDPDDATKQMLAFVCVNHKCDAHGEPVRAEDSCVFQKVYKKTFIDVKDKEATKSLILKTYGMADDIISDPTLPRSRDVTCSECGHFEAVFFQLQGMPDREAMRLFFVCTNCKHQWTY